MRKANAVTWVVYAEAGPGGVRSVCEQGEWEEMEKAQPGRRSLVKEGIATEGEAEGLARAGVVAAEAAKAEQQRRARRG
jgi:hypothetical protein